MIANNSCGAHSVMTGRTSDNLAEMEVALADGTRLRVGPTGEDELEAICAGSDRRAEIYRGCGRCATATAIWCASATRRSRGGCRA
jgi:FAD/FMN-containing dehydrogenase